MTAKCVDAPPRTTPKTICSHLYPLYSATVCRILYNISNELMPFQFDLNLL